MRFSSAYKLPYLAYRLYINTLIHNTHSHYCSPQPPTPHLHIPTHYTHYVQSSTADSSHLHIPTHCTHTLCTVLNRRLFPPPHPHSAHTHTHYSPQPPTPHLHIPTHCTHTHYVQSSTAHSPPPPSHSGSLGDLGLTGSAIKEDKKTSSKARAVTNVHGIIRNVIQDASAKIGSEGPQVLCWYSYMCTVTLYYYSCCY